MLDGVVFDLLPLSFTAISETIITSAGQEAPVSDGLTPPLRLPGYIKVLKVGGHHSLLLVSWCQHQSAR